MVRSLNPIRITMTTGTVCFPARLYLRALLVKGADRSDFLAERCSFTAQNFLKLRRAFSVKAVTHAAGQPHKHRAHPEQECT